MRFEGDVVFITGAASGIGRATAEQCAAEGATVIVTDVDTPGGEEAVERIEDSGGDAEFHELDVTDEEAFADAIDATVAEYGLDVLVNNAGTGHPRHTSRTPTPPCAITSSTSISTASGTAVTPPSRR